MCLDLADLYVILFPVNTKYLWKTQLLNAYGEWRPSDGLGTVIKSLVNSDPS